MEDLRERFSATTPFLGKNPLEEVSKALWNEASRELSLVGYIYDRSIIISIIEERV